jgi:hypothetical protein
VIERSKVSLEEQKHRQVKKGRGKEKKKNGFNLIN